MAISLYAQSIWANPSEWCCLGTFETEHSEREPNFENEKKNVTSCKHWAAIVRTSGGSALNEHFIVICAMTIIGNLAVCVCVFHLPCGCHSWSISTLRLIVLLQRLRWSTSHCCRRCCFQLLLKILIDHFRSAHGVCIGRTNEGTSEMPSWSRSTHQVSGNQWLSHPLGYHATTVRCVCVLAFLYEWTNKTNIRQCWYISNIVVRRYDY